MVESHPPRILVIEDDEGYQELLATVLSPLYSVVVSSTMEDAAKKIDAEKFHLIISDIHLQNKSGLELLMKLQTSGRLKDCPVLLCSSQKDADTKQLAKNMGASGFIEKPLQVDPFLEEIRGLIKNTVAAELPRILVIEDDEEYQQLLVTVLSPLYTVIVSSTMEDGANKIDAEKFHLIISDIHLQNKSGLELLMKLQTTGRLKDCPVLLCSSQSDPDTKQLAKNMGASGFVAKPLQVDPFLEEIRTLLKSAR